MSQIRRASDATETRPAMPVRIPSLLLAALLTALMAVMAVAPLGAQEARRTSSDGDAAPNGEAAHATSTTTRQASLVGSADRGGYHLRALRLEGDAAVEVDGVLDEPVWGSAEVATDFVQFRPDEGEAPSQRTEARVAYGSDALYVAVRAFDTAPDSIAGQLTRRDDSGSYSDWVRVIVDSHYDQRTGFHFAVNPSGVKQDIYHYDDTREDSSWDAVWEVATSRDEDGWTAEFRIPFSQLRFQREEETWGINFARDIARTGETVVWAPLSSDESRLISRSGTLQGLTGLPSTRRLEVQPYAVARLARENGSVDDPFFRENDHSQAMGLDLKYGVTSDLTLDLTVNPDFGQVEADPAQVNLSAFETFLPEQRPFFIEGQNIFEFGLGLGGGGAESLFYTRRIGRQPQGRVSAGPGGFVDAEDQTMILGAAKLSGKTGGGWSVGLLYAATQEEEARIVTADGERLGRMVEPFTNYGVARIQRDFREGRTAIGFIGTGTVRDREGADELLLHRSAVTGGVDFRHRFGEDRYQLTGHVLGSSVRGSREALARTQLSSARYFQRPDADHVEFDPTREGLGGWAGSVGIHRIGGEHWRFGSDVLARSPGFEVNDIGFLRESDQVLHAGFLSYRVNRPTDRFRQWNLNLNAHHAYTFDGERIGIGSNVNGFAQLANFWTVNAGVARSFDSYSNSMLRGGPLLRREAAWNGWGGVGTDSRQALRFGLDANWSARPTSDSWSLNLSPSVRWRPTSAATVSVGGFWNRNLDDREWVGRVAHDDGSADYVLGRLDQTTVGLTGRLDMAFTPNVSLQLYAQPFVSSGSYGAFKVVTDPRADEYADRFRRLDARPVSDLTYEADTDADGTPETFGNPDFDFRQFRSNAVLRWEFRPSSTLFLVWLQGRDGFAMGRDAGEFGFSDDFGDLFGRAPENVFMMKVSYWLSP